MLLKNNFTEDFLLRKKPFPALRARIYLFRNVGRRVLSVIPWKIFFDLYIFPGFLLPPPELWDFGNPDDNFSSKTLHPYPLFPTFTLTSYHYLTYPYSLPYHYPYLTRWIFLQNLPVLNFEKISAPSKSAPSCRGSAALFPPPYFSAPSKIAPSAVSLNIHKPAKNPTSYPTPCP